MTCGVGPDALTAFNVMRAPFPQEIHVCDICGQMWLREHFGANGSVDFNSDSFANFCEHVSIADSAAEQRAMPRQVLFDVVIIFWVLSFLFWVRSFEVQRILDMAHTCFHAQICRPSGLWIVSTWGYRPPCL